MVVNDRSGQAKGTVVPFESVSGYGGTSLPGAAPVPIALLLREVRRDQQNAASADSRTSGSFGFHERRFTG